MTSVSADETGLRYAIESELKIRTDVPVMRQTSLGWVGSETSYSSDPMIG